MINHLTSISFFLSLSSCYVWVKEKNPDLEGDGLKVKQLSDDGRFEQEHGMNDATNTTHSQTTVFDFLQLHTVIHLEVEWIEAHFAWNGTVGKHVCVGDAAFVRDKLDEAAEEEDLPEACGGDLEEGFGGERVLEFRSGQMNKFLHDDAEEGKHTDTTVLDLGLL